MKRDQLMELKKWLQGQIQAANKVIYDAHDTHNYGREALYEGMRDAFMRCLNQLPRH